MQAQQFNDNIRTMMAGFNTVSNFPGDYNGGDPLAAHTVERVKEHTAMMVKAIGGDADANAFFDDPLHQIYCAELAHVATSAGLIVPLNATTMVPVVGQEAWDKFIAEVSKHNAARALIEQDGELYEKLAAGDEAALTEAGIEISAFVAGNDNKRVALVELTLADEGLLAAAEYAPAESQAAERVKIAFKPMTMADIVEQFLRTHVPREQLGETMAPVQGMLLQKMKPGLLEAMGMDQMPDEDPRKVAVNGLFGQLVQVVSTPYGSYQEFRTALELALRRRGDAELAFWRQGDDIRDKVEETDEKGNKVRYPIWPDGFFRIKTPKGMLHFFLEADRSTMTNARFVRKIKGYPPVSG